jgi:hypothetical protein
VCTATARVLLKGHVLRGHDEEAAISLNAADAYDSRNWNFSLICFTAYTKGTAIVMVAHEADL